jgi:hypothetical protein
LLVLLLTATTGAWAQTQWTSGDCTVTLNNGTLTVSGNGTMADYANLSDRPWVNNIGDITSVVVESGVTSVGMYAFYNCTSITSVTLPEGLTAIGDGAFGGCSSLQSITIPSTVTSISAGAFYSCSAMTSVTLPEGLTAINAMAFYECSSLTSVTIPSTVTSIGQGAFWSCSSLTSITIPSTVTSIADFAFYSCSAISDVNLYANPDNLTWGSASMDFKSDKATQCHVLAEHLSTYQNKFSSVNVTFVGDLQPLTPPTYSITLAEGTEDAENWKGKAGEGEYQKLPLEGVAEGAEVTVTYSGEKKVKSVKAVKKAPAVDPAKAYLTWDADQKKLVATEIPAEATMVTSSTTTWTAGTYVVEGNVEINGTIRLNGDVDLIIKDDAELTANKIQGGNKNLCIYGQANKSGQLVVNSTTDAISNITTLEVHSAKVTATASANNCGGILNIGTFNVYGGLVDAKSTGSRGYGITLKENGYMNIYGGEVKAEGKGNNVNYSYGIRCGNSLKATVTVYGGKLWAGNADNKALKYITLAIDKSLGFNGEIQCSPDNSTWNPTVGTPDEKYVRVGY